MSVGGAEQAESVPQMTQMNADQHALSLDRANVIEDVVADLMFLKAWEAGQVPGLKVFLRFRHIRLGNPVLADGREGLLF